MINIPESFARIAKEVKNSHIPGIGICPITIDPPEKINSEYFNIFDFLNFEPFTTERAAKAVTPIFITASWASLSSL